MLNANINWLNVEWQVGFPVEIQIHNSWLFFPWHRWYLYFHERILGKLIGDDTFALPFWNWDSPQGMPMPTMYTTRFELYDPLRDPLHQPPAIVDFNYDLVDSNISREQLVSMNLNVMYRQLVWNKTPTLFLGAPYRAGDEPNPGPGSLESQPHNPVHLWVGDRNQPNLEDMGDFYSAGRDPIFFAHHANIDRLWKVWKSLGGRNRRDFTDPDWLNAGFLFYDENARVVLVKVSECLDTKDLGYMYEDVGAPWLNARPKPDRRRPDQSKFEEFGDEPRTLGSIIRAKVKREVRSRSKKEKEREEEVLVIEGIETRRDIFVKFDVYVNVGNGEIDMGPDVANLVGSFVNVPHHPRADREEAANLRTRQRFALTDLLDELGVDGDEETLVSIVPSVNGEHISIEGVKIELTRN